MNKLFESIVTWVNLKFGKEQAMIPPHVMTYAAKFLWDIIEDPVQNFAKENLKKHLDKAPKELVDAFDKGVEDDKDHDHKSILDWIK